MAQARDQAVPAPVVARLVLGPAAEDLVETRMAWVDRALVDQASVDQALVDQVLEDPVSEGQVSAAVYQQERMRPERGVLV